MGEHEGALDGRVLRGRRTKDAVVEAFLSLIEDGDPQPRARAIAERAGVSLRSVFQHFADLESLYLAAGKREMDKVGPMMTPLDPELPLDQRIDHFVAQRVLALETMAPVARVARLREPFSAQLRTNRDLLKQTFRIWIEQAFAPELARLDATSRADTVEAILAGASFSAWYALRDEQGLEVAQARTALHLIVRRLMRPVPAS